MTQAWQLLPLPWWAGAPFLWQPRDARPAQRRGRPAVRADRRDRRAARAPARHLDAFRRVRGARARRLVRYKRQVAWNGWIDVAILLPVGYVVYRARQHTGRAAG
jgi:hypothetical protein